MTSEMKASQILPYLGGEKLTSLIGAPWDRGFDPSSSTSYSFIRNLWLSMVLAASGSSDIQVASITVNLGHSYQDYSVNPIQPSLLASQPSDATSASIISTRVKSLDVLLSTGSDREAWRSDLSTVIGNFPGLESFRVALAELNDGNDIAFPTYSSPTFSDKAILIPGLRDLQLSRIYGTDKQLTTLIEAHRTTLHVVTLHKVHLWEGTDWAALVRTWHDMMPKCKLMMRKCLFRDEWLWPEDLALVTEQDFISGIATLAEACYEISAFKAVPRVGRQNPSNRPTTPSNINSTISI